jgi:hypothetical protein
MIIKGKSSPFNQENPYRGIRDYPHPEIVWQDLIGSIPIGSGISHTSQGSG